MEEYRTHYFYITPIHPAALDKELMQQILAGQFDSWQDSPLVLNVYTALALGTTRMNTMPIF